MDDITAFMNERNKVLVEMTEKVLKKGRERCGGEGLEAIARVRESVYVCRERLVERYERETTNTEKTLEKSEREDRLSDKQRWRPNKLHKNSYRFIFVYLHVPMVTSCDAMRVV